ncbi:MAG: M16 family metallopeptidase, partial [Pirellulaceae bacterium]
MKLPSKIRTWAVAGLMAGVIAMPCVAQQPSEVTEVEGITEYRLENGLQLLLFPDDSKPTFTINMTIGVGSRHEGYGETGMAHLLEHMLFKGTPTHRDPPKLLKDRGVIDMNGTTWVDRTNYYETLPATDDNLEFAIRMEADRLVNSTILAEDLASEMTVVRNEFERGENSPISVLRQRMMATAFEWHNYGKSTIGNRSDIERVPINNLRAFYERFYQPDNVMLVIAGKYDQEKALDWVQEYFGALSRPKTKRDSTWTEEPAQDGERTVILRRVGEVPIVGVLYHVPAASHPDFAAIQVLGSILSREPSGRLYKALVEPGVMTSVFAGARPTHDPGALMGMGQVGEGHTAEAARDQLIEILEGGSLATIDETEVKRAVQQLLKRRENLLADSQRLALELSEWYGYGDWRLFFLHRDRLEQVTPEKVREVAAQYLLESNRTVGMFIPSEDVQRVRVPNAAAIETMVGNYTGREAVAAGESFVPTPETIDARTIRGEFQNGISYALLPKETRGDRVTLSLQLHFGDEESLKGRVTAVELLGSLMTKGAGDMNHEELKDYLDEKRINLSVSSGLGSLTVNMRTRREFLMDALDVMQQVLRQPVLPEDQFEIERKSQLSQLRASLPEPQMLAITTFMRSMMPHPVDDVRYSPTLEESIERMEAVTIDQVRELYEQFIGGPHGEVAVVGDFDADEVSDRLEAMFDGWVAKQPYSRIESS